MITNHGPEKYNILVIEDNEMFLKLALEMLEGHHYTGATNAEDGIKKFKSLKPDITFLDITLPDGSGHQILKAIKEQDPSAFVVMLTGSSLQKDVQESLMTGAKGYIVKPFSRAQIKECIQRYKEHKTKLTKSA